MELEAKNAAAILVQGIEEILPQTLVVRPFESKLPDVTIVIGLPSLHPKPQAETFARLLIEEARAGESSMTTKASISNSD